ncbi:MAG: hypothetical protein AAFZ15_22895 [Bacteroidota bacterium]
MGEILDDYVAPKKSSTIFSKISLALAILNSFLLIVFLLIVPEQVYVGMEFSSFVIILVRSFGFFSLSGFVITMISILKKEKRTVVKWVGGTINILIFISLVSFVIYGNILLGRL